MSVLVRCAKCSVEFWITAHLNERRHEDHQSFYCPNGHSNYYPAPKVSEEQREIVRLKDRWAESAEYNRRTIETLEEWKRAARICPICEERVTTAQFIETIRAKVAEHLRDEHGAKARLRAITEKASAAS